MKSDGQTGTEILLEAMSRDKAHLARFVLDALDGEIVDSRTESAQTPLISSILLPDNAARCKFAELLLQKGANVNCRDDAGRTALSHACEKGHLDAVKILVRHNADPEIVDSWGNSALMYAAVAGHSPVVEFLVRAFKRLGLQIDRQNKVGNSAVEVARFLGHAECIFALTHGSRRGRGGEDGGGAAANAQTRLGSGGGDGEDGFETRVGHLVNALGDLQTCDHTGCLSVQSCTWQPRPRAKQSALPAMDSIDEFERENSGSSSPARALVFSEILNPKASPRVPDPSQNHKHPKPGGDHLLPLQPGSNAPNPRAPSALDILLAPIASNKRETEAGTERSKVFDHGVRRLNEKRFSLPTSMLSPVTRDRALVPVWKSRTVRRRDASPCKAEALLLTAPTAATSTTAFSTLGNKLLRRFTSPEFKNGAKELAESPMLTSGGIPRSETFPQRLNHPLVGSKPSIDSISSVKCEFGVLK